MRLRLFIRPALAFGLLSTLLGGCAEMHRGLEAVASVGLSPSAPVEELEVAPASRPDIKTVRPRGAPRVPASDTSAAGLAEAPTVVAAAVPTPQQIFDFHPAGSAPGTFRQPFIIDPNDGPLAADVRRTAAELKAFEAAMKSGTAVASGKQCGEMDVVHGKPGCGGQKPKVASMISRDPLALK